MTTRRLRKRGATLGLTVVAVLTLLVTMWFGASAPAAAQGNDRAPMDIGASGPNGHEIGAQFTVTTEGGAFLGACTLEGDPAVPLPLSCRVSVPRFTTVVVTLDVETIAPGYAPVENPISFDTSSDPGAASHWGVFFQLEPQDNATSEGQTAQAIANGGPWTMAIGATTEEALPPGGTFDARFVVTSEEGDYVGECTLEGIGSTGGLQVCHVDVPSDRVSLVWQDETLIPAGFVPIENPIAFDPTSYVPGPHHIGAWFRNAPIDGSTAQTSDVAIETTEDGGSATDVCYVLVDFSNEGCDRNDDGLVTFEDVPLGTYTVRQTADLGPGRAVDDFTIQVRGNVSPAGWESFAATIVGSSTSPSAPGSSGPVDIALITREPVNGDLLTGTCYVLVGYSNEGCDENGDGQVTFADIPFGTYTVRQTQTPAGYPAINDFEITVAGTGYMEAPSVGVPLGFIVRQAPEQNAPNTRNVSVVFLDMFTHERVTHGACVELIGASQVGCDRDLIDGQVDFLDVPAGGPYELRFSNLPAGAQVGEVGGPLAVIIDAGPGDAANVTVFVLLAGLDGSGNTTIDPAGSGSSNGAQDPAGTDGVVEATVLLTFRGCPEGFIPDVDDPFTACTIPLDAPDASRVGELGVGPRHVPITGLDRQYDGSYIFSATSDVGYSLELTGLEPVLRDGFLIYGVDDQAGSSYITLLDNGETRDIFVFYYYD